MWGVGCVELRRLPSVQRSPGHEDAVHDGVHLASVIGHFTVVEREGKADVLPALFSHRGEDGILHQFTEGEGDLNGEVRLIGKGLCGYRKGRAVTQADDAIRLFNRPRTQLGRNLVVCQIPQRRIRGKGGDADGCCGADGYRQLQGVGKRKGDFLW